MATWDPINGVWEGGDIPKTDDLISPLYIFGYGSLLWRPGDLLGKYPSFACKCFGWKRKFSQRSMDHRGNPEFPGMVVTMIEDDMPPPGCSAAIATDCAEAEGTGNISSVNGPSECLGLVFLVPDAESGALIRELDWRERGGYSRHVVSVQLLATSPLHRAGDRVQAVVYTGTTCNPNFFDPVSEEVVWGRVPAVGPVSGYRRYPPRLYGRDIVADIISTAQGPSGHNIDYLFQLTSYFKQLLSQGPVLEGAVAVGGGRVETDFYLLALESKVRMRLGAWRGFCLGPDPPNKTLSSPHTRIGECVDMCNFPLESCRNGGAGACGCGLAVVGFGNNEAGQVLGRSTPVPHLLAATAVDLVTRALDEANRTAAVVGDPDQSCGTSLGLYCYDPLFAEGCESSVGAVVAIVSVYAGSNHSGILFSNGELYVWGGAGATGTNTTATPLRRLQGVIGASFGFDYILALHRSGAVLSLRLGGSEGVGACPGMPDFVVPVQGLGSGARDGQLGAGADTVQRSGVASRVNISHLSCGLHHAVAVGAEDGRCVLYSWGDSRHGQRPTAVDAEDGVDAEAEVHQSLPPLPPRESEASISARPVALPSLAPTNLSASFPYSPSATTGVRSLACGARHTVLIDSNNNVWSCGDNRYGSLGRVVPGGSGAADPVLRRVAQNLPSGAYWQRICSGWSHVVLRGHQSSADDFCATVCLGWGRADMGQLGISPAQLAVYDSDQRSSNGRGLRFPQPLPGLAGATGADGAASLESERLGEVWCGAEHTVVCDDACGLLYSAGWNDHGTLGLGDEAKPEPRPDAAGQPSDAWSVYTWTPVVTVDGAHLALPSIYEGYLAAGGAHCIAVTTIDDHHT